MAPRWVKEPGGESDRVPLSAIEMEDSPKRKEHSNEVKRVVGRGANQEKRVEKFKPVLTGATANDFCLGEKMVCTSKTKANCLEHPGG